MSIKDLKMTDRQACSRKQLW